jgi:hypothetical protein
MCDLTVSTNLSCCGPYHPRFISVGVAEHVKDVSGSGRYVLKVDVSGRYLLKKHIIYH